MFLTSSSYFHHVMSESSEKLVWESSCEWPLRLNIKSLVGWLKENVIFSGNKNEYFAEMSRHFQSHKWATKPEIFYKMSRRLSAMLLIAKRGVFDETPGQFPAALEATKLNILDVTSGHFPALIVATKASIFVEISGQEKIIFSLT